MANKINYHVTLDELLSPLKAKSGIHIKPENKGKFTAYKKTTGETTSQALHSKNPHVRKMANFARNAKKWHHADDGEEITPNSLPTYIDPSQRLNLSEQDQPTPEAKKNPWGVGANYALEGLTGIDALIPNRRIRRQVVPPTRAYNQNPYGTGSSAIMEVGGYVEDPKRFGYFKDEASNKLTFKKGGFMPGVNQFPRATGTDAYNLMVFRDGGEVDNKLVFDLGGDLKDNLQVWEDGGNIQPMAFPGNPNPRKSSYPKDQQAKKKWIADLGAAVPGGDPSKSQKSAQEQYYENSATLSYYKNKLNDQLKAKNPQGFGDYFKGLTDLRRSGKTQDADQYIQKSGYNDYLSPDEVKKSLGADYPKYLESLKNVNAYNVKQGQQPLYGNIEGESDDPSTLNYGRRFASLQVTPSFGVTSQNQTAGTAKKFSRQYSYDPSKGVSYTDTGDASLRPDYLSAPQSPAPVTPSATTPSGTMDDGGVMQAGQQGVGFHYGGGAKTISYNPYSGPTMQFEGPSHEEGGIGMSYGGKKVEVEGNETGFVNQDGDFNVMGNMKVPRTNKKFKQVSKEIAKQENGAMSKARTGAQLMEEGDPNDQFDYLKFNSGRATTMGADQRLKKLAQAKEQLAGVQRTILDTADRMGLEPNDLAAGKYTPAARNGYQIKADDGTYVDPDEGPGKPSVAKRHNNPGNLKYAPWMQKYGAVPGNPATDGGKFAKFPDVKSGLNAMSGLLTGSTYKDLPVEDAIKRWTGGKTYNIPLGDLRGKKVGDLDAAGLDRLKGVITQGEDSGYYDPGNQTVNYGGGKSNVGLTPEITPIASGESKVAFNPAGIPIPKGVTYGQAQPDATPMGDVDMSSNPIQSSARLNKLKPDQLLGEMFAAASNHVEPVPMQKYQPALYQPYQVSFQDRINDNQSTFTELAKKADYNPAALASLGAQKYSADNAVKAEEFRTNQGIAQDITNKNVGILNDAQLKNLQLADTQMVRQATARSKTKAQTQTILNSVSSKILQNDLENTRLKTYEPLFDYRYATDEDGKITGMDYEGGPAHINFSGMPMGAGGVGSGGDARNKIIRNAAGDIKETQQTFKPQSEEEMAQLRLMMQKRKAYRPPGQ